MPRRSSRSIRRVQLPSRPMSAKRNESRSVSQRKASQSESRSMHNRSSRSERSIRRRESRRCSVEKGKKEEKEISNKLLRSIIHCQIRQIEKQTKQIEEQKQKIVELEAALDFSNLPDELD